MAFSRVAVLVYALGIGLIVAVATLLTSALANIPSEVRGLIVVMGTAVASGLALAGALGARHYLRTTALAPIVRSKLRWREHIYRIISGLGKPSELMSVVVDGRTTVNACVSRPNLTILLCCGVQLGLFVGFAGAYVGGREAGLVGSLLGGQAGLWTALLVTAGASALFNMAESGREMVESGAPARYAGRQPDAVLRASRASGVGAGSLGGTAVGAVVGVVSGLSLGGPAGLALGVASGLLVALTVALLLGLTPWLYHYWLRLRLARRGWIPGRLPRFMEWCADPSRGWLRVSDAYEFRHSELVEHLVRGPMSADADPPTTERVGPTALHRDA